MDGKSLLNLIENIQTWDILEKRIAELPTEMQRGNAFEEFCHAFFLLDPVFQFKEVYRQNEIPPSVRERLGYPGTPEGYLLGAWQNNQKVCYKKGKLSPDRIKRLEDIGFKWQIREEQLAEQFEKGFQETLIYNDKTGNANAPRSYKTAEVYHLGTWQRNQRGNYKKGKL